MVQALLFSKTRTLCIGWITKEQLRRSSFRPISLNHSGCLTYKHSLVVFKGPLSYKTKAQAVNMTHLAQHQIMQMYEIDPAPPV